MEITLNNEIFIAPAPKARMVRKALELSDAVDFNNLKATGLDALAAYVCDLFVGQFTIDELYDGLEAAELMQTLTQCINGVVNATSKKIDEFPNAAVGK